MNAPGGAARHETPEPDRRSSRLLSEGLGWGLLVALLGFASFVHHGIGPSRPGFEGAWYDPSRFFFESETLVAWLDPAPLAFLTLGLPACMLAVGVFLTTRSAIAKALALASVAAIGLFAFYGLVAPLPWRFFGWRGSVVLALVALIFGFAAAAPLLASRWLRLSWPARIAVYLPFIAFVIAFLRNATGTDPNLPFAISPWPVVSVFGFEVVGLFLAIGWIGTAIGVAGVARGGGGRSVALAVAAGLLTPVLLLFAGSGLGLFPFRVGPRLVFAVGFACALAIGVACTLAARDRARVLPRRARDLSAGAALLAVPLLSGQSWAYFDYYLTRQVQARGLIDGLEAYLDRESLYPDTLEELIETGDLESIPDPAIGFDFLYDGEFRYQSFGTSFLLEFPAPRWVQCAYTPAVVYEDYDDEDDEDLEAADLGETWSCPSQPPELW